MKLQIRDKRDPFTQALAFLFSNEKNTNELRRKLREEMIPLVTSVAVKIGGIDTEKAVRDRALAVFTGTISLHLAHISVGKQGDLVTDWANIVKGTDLKLLFRNGYALINELVVIAMTEVGFGDWVANIHKRGFLDNFITKVEYLEKHSTKRDETGLWIGYTSLNNMFNTKEWYEYTLWLLRQACAERDIIDKPHEYISAETIVNRILINIFISGKPSIAMDFRRVEKVIKLAYGKKRWLAEAKKRYSSFLLTVPERFRSELLTQGSSLLKFQEHFWGLVESWPTKKHTYKQTLINLCFDVDVPPPGYEKLEKHVLEEYKID